MIRVGYINQYDIYDETVDFINDQYMMAESAYSDYMTLVNRINEYAFIEGVSESDQELMEEGAKEVVEKIGQAVINTIDKVIELIKKCIENITGLIFKHKDTSKELDKLLADHPELKNEVIIALQKGDMDLKSLKDVNELLDTSQDIINKMEAGKLEPSKAEELYNKAVDKLEKAKPFLTTIAAVGSALSAVLIVHKFLPSLREQKMNAEFTKQRLETMKAKSNIDKMESEGKTSIPVEGIARMKNKIINKCCLIVSKQMNATTKTNNRFTSAIDGFMKKHLFNQKTYDSLKGKKTKPVRLDSERKRYDALKADIKEFSDIIKPGSIKETSDKKNKDN